jgi:hypothetical protein
MSHQEQKRGKGNEIWNEFAHLQNMESRKGGCNGIGPSARVRLTVRPPAKTLAVIGRDVGLKPCMFFKRLLR